MIARRTKIEFARGRAGRRRMCPRRPNPQWYPTAVPRISEADGVGHPVRGPDSGRAGVGPVGTGPLGARQSAADHQIMNLFHLAPDIQESLLFLPRVTSGKAPIHEKLLRPIAAEVDWREQREMWAEVKRAGGTPRRPRRRQSRPGGQSAAPGANGAKDATDAKTGGAAPPVAGRTGESRRAPP